MCQNDASSFSLYNHRFAIFQAQRKNLRDSLIKHKFDTM